MNDFYVGYLPQAPTTLARFVRKVTIVLGLLAVTAALALVAGQMPFANSAFEYGKLRSFEGVIVTRPFPTLLVARPGEVGQQDKYSRYLLVAPGKHGADDLVAKVNGGFLDFDVAIATPDLMGQVGGLGRVLGPRGLMPNPKTGTVTTDVAKAVTEFKGGRVEYRSDKIGNVQVRVGKVSFSLEDLARNVQSVVDEIVRVKPASAKGRYLMSITVSSTMGPGVKIDPARTKVVDEAVSI